MRSNDSQDGNESDRTDVRPLAKRRLLRCCFMEVLADGHLFKMIVAFSPGLEPRRWVNAIKAARAGHLYILQARSTCLNYSTYVFREACASGHLNIVQWCHDTNWPGCFADAMDFAAGAGHLEIVKFLHQHRTEGCTTHAMDSAALRGHLHVMKWLHAHRKEGCTVEAMNSAAFCGHLDIVRWLVENDMPWIPDEAINLAKSRGHVQIVDFLKSTLASSKATRRRRSKQRRQSDAKLEEKEDGGMNS
ncbi:unnamed protein product [Aphanomyces euteiches]